MRQPKKSGWLALIALVTQIPFLALAEDQKPILGAESVPVSEQAADSAPGIEVPVPPVPAAPSGKPAPFPKRFTLLPPNVTVAAPLDNLVPDVRINKLSAQTRYRYQTDLDGVPVKNLMQYRLIGDIDIFLFKDKVRINMSGGTGTTFETLWNDTDWGKTSKGAVTTMNVRRLSLTLTPYKGIDLTFGDMAPEYGAGTENSYLDADGYIIGYRASAAIENGKLVVTTGHMDKNRKSDFFLDPNAFHRLNEMADIDYVQVVLTQTIAEILKGSIEYDHAGGDDLTRIAMDLDLRKWTSFLDGLIVEDMIDVTSYAKSSIIDQNILASSLRKKFEAVLCGRDINVLGTYYYNKDMTLPIFDELFKGNGSRLYADMPAVVSYRGVNLGLYTKVVNNLDDLKQVRLETGLMFTF